MAEEQPLSWSPDANILLRIYRNCAAEDAARAACVCKLWNVVLSDDKLWWRHCAEDFGTGGILARKEGFEPVRMHGPKRNLTIPVESLDNLSFKSSIDYRRSYGFWRGYFATFLDDLPKVRRLGDICRRLRAWQHIRQPGVDFESRSGADMEAWDWVREHGVCGVRFPDDLMLLYRFMEGCRQGWSARRQPIGMLGTYAFDSPEMTSRLESLADVARSIQHVHEGQSSLQLEIFFASAFSKDIGIDIQDGSIYCPDARGRRSRMCPEGKTVIDWLEKYVQRLESGAYGTRMVSVLTPPYKLPVVSLFPASVEAGMREEITDGVRVRVSAVFVPDHSQCSRGLFFFTYSVRFYLLREEEQMRIYGRAKHSVQLRDRHWILRNGAGGVHNTVTGAGVIGEYPILTPGSEEFAYESFTESREPKTSMDGFFTFVEGTMAYPTGPSFPAKCPRFELEVPDYCY